MKILFFLFISLSVFAQNPKLKKIEALPKELNESSGLEVWGDYLISHNDGGANELFVLTKKGELVKKIIVDGAKNHDWEDLAKDNKGNLYIGDFGNNSNKRNNLTIYKIKKFNVKKDTVKAQKIKFEYKKQKDFPPKKSKLNFDAEAFVVFNDTIHLFTKDRTKPYLGKSYVYKFPAKKGKYKIKHHSVIQHQSSKGWQLNSITSACIFNQDVLLLSAKSIYRLKNYCKIQDVSQIETYSISGIKQREAIAADKNIIYSTDEKHHILGGGNLYRIFY